ncbi:hypothetical protein V1387_12815 [Allomuricauda taeanensis]|uniref:hypothetical protein n=1 Tax=Flagellimonas taeanensis TaxID=1005926 RepID=UPI002E7BF293|nr:hypothetical protein [Allomuricauda taeanensis]MEE1963572.1 hypothetical protein [Allomuricauda taeanensis]
MLFYQNSENGWQYILFYFDENIAKLEYMKNIPFFGTPEDLAKVYGIFMDVFEKDDIRTFGLGKVELRISLSGESKEMLISVKNEDGEESYFNLTRRQVDMLFGN